MIFNVWFRLTTSSDDINCSHGQIAKVTIEASDEKSAAEIISKRLQKLLGDEPLKPKSSNDISFINFRLMQILQEYCYEANTLALRITIKRRLITEFQTLQYQGYISKIPQLYCLTNESLTNIHVVDDSTLEENLAAGWKLLDP